MKKTEILKILEKIESMKTITKVKINTEGFEMTVEKTNQIPIHSSSGKIRESNAAPGMASEFQIKYARDLIRKVFGNDESAGLDFLAHTLEMLLEDVPDIDTWDTALTIGMVSSIIDALQPMHGKSKGGD